MHRSLAVIVPLSLSLSLSLLSKCKIYIHTYYTYICIVKYVPLILMRHLCSEASSYALLHQAKAPRITTEIKVKDKLVCTYG